MEVTCPKFNFSQKTRTHGNLLLNAFFFISFRLSLSLSPFLTFAYVQIAADLTVRESINEYESEEKKKSIQSHFARTNSPACV